MAQPSAELGIRELLNPFELSWCIEQGLRAIPHRALHSGHPADSLHRALDAGGPSPHQCRDFLANGSPFQVLSGVINF